MTQGSDTHSLPPAIVFGGNDNALAVARSLGRRAIAVNLLTPSPTPHRSRFATSIALPGRQRFADEALEFLLGSDGERLAGAVLLAGSDEAIQAMLDHRDPLAERFLLEHRVPSAARLMLDKLETYRIAREHGVPTPGFWTVSDDDEDLAQLGSEVPFPLIVKPLHTYLFAARFGAKFIVAENERELADALSFTRKAGVPTLLTELIPGPDSALCSYYTYIDERAQPQFDVTKRIIRRKPPGMGLATYHITDDVPEIVPLAQALFRGAGVQGIANVEFKFDHRDSTYKLIECNARFTASIALLDQAGADLAGFVYDSVVGNRPAPVGPIKSGLTMWDPVRDFGAYRHLHGTEGMKFTTWLRSVARRHAVIDQFSWRDPLPEIERLYLQLRSRIST